MTRLLLTVVLLFGAVYAVMCSTGRASTAQDVQSFSDSSRGLTTSGCPVSPEQFALTLLRQQLYCVVAGQQGTMFVSPGPSNSSITVNGITSYTFGSPQTIQSKVYFAFVSATQVFLISFSTSECSEIEQVTLHDYVTQGDSVFYPGSCSAMTASTFAASVEGAYCSTQEGDVQVSATGTTLSVGACTLSVAGSPTTCNYARDGTGVYTIIDSGIATDCETHTGRSMLIVAWYSDSRCTVGGGIGLASLTGTPALSATTGACFTPPVFVIPDPEETTSDGGLSSGAKAGIVIAVVALVGVAICVAIRVCRKRRAARSLQRKGWDEPLTDVSYVRNLP